MLLSRSVNVVKGLAVWGGKQALFFHPLPPSEQSNSSDLLSRPRVWLTWKLWLARCHPAMSCGAVDGRSSWQRPELPCSSQLSPCCFFHMGAPPHASVGLGEAEVVFLSISISRRENRDGRCVSGSPCFFTPRNTVYDIPGTASLSAQPAPGYTQTAQASDSGQAHTALLLTLEYAQLRTV